MEIHLPEPEGLHLPLRARLLGGALVAHLRGTGHILMPAAPRLCGPGAIADTQTLAALPPNPHSPDLASLGLGLPGALAQGPATLLLVQSLEAELTSFGTQAGWSDPAQIANTLAGYSRAILLDRADVARSIGFAPWINLQLADRFPVSIPLPDPAPEPQLLILDHGAPPGQAQALAREVSDLGPSVILATGQEANARALIADMHLHLGYGADRPVVALSPFDSLMAGAYTLVLPGLGRGAGAALRDMISARSYAALLDRPGAVVEATRAMASRRAAVTTAGQAQNPEITRHAPRNAADRTAALTRFDAALTGRGAQRQAA